MAVEDFLCAKGNVWNVGNYQQGIYSVEGLENGQGASSRYPLIIQSVEYTKKDVMLPVKCLGSKNILYSFGDGFGDATVGGIVLLGPDGKDSQLGFLVNWFHSKRASRSSSPVNVSIVAGNSKGFRFYATTLVIGRPDTQFHTQPFSIGGILVE